MGKMVMIIRCM